MAALHHVATLAIFSPDLEVLVVVGVVLLRGLLLEVRHLDAELLHRLLQIQFKTPPRVGAVPSWSSVHVDQALQRVRRARFLH